MVTTETLKPHPQVSVIVPARNEEASLADCLRSLSEQSGVTFEIIVVDDHSTDRTREIATSFPGVKVIEAGPLPAGWTGKNNAVTSGANAAHGQWLLFTDADTVHLPGSLSRSLDEAQRNGAPLLSYSPEQIVTGFWEKAVQPVIFAELSAHYRPSQVSDPNSPAAAANGQYILVTREAYDAIGGHATVATSLLEDVELARAIKQSGRKIFFRYGGDAVRTRMYRSFLQLREGWTKNLAILFPSPAWLAFWRALEFVAFIASTALLIHSIAAGDFRYAPLYLLAPVFTYARISRAHFSVGRNSSRSFGHSSVFIFITAFETRPSVRQGKLEGQNLWFERQRKTSEGTQPNDSHYRRTALMKLAVTLIVPMLLLGLSSHATLPGIRTMHPVASLQATALSGEVNIEPGASIGPLKLGDTRERALELFPKKDEDQEWNNSCGTTLDWVDSTNPTGRGDVFIRLKKGKVFQIESATTRFHTAEGITTFDHGEKVAAAYKDLRAYTLLSEPDPAHGSRPLVFWIDKKRGIAFVFAYYPKEHKRYVYKIIVFEPNKTFCPEEDTMGSAKWQAIPQYALEPPIELAPN